MFYFRLKQYLILSFSLLFVSFCWSQPTSKILLKQKVSDNAKLFKINIDKAYLQMNPLLKNARILNDSISELKLLDRKCRYFYSKNKIDSLMKSSEKLQIIAKEYHDFYSEAMGNLYMAEAYSINQFCNKAISHLDIAYGLLERDKSKKNNIFFAKANVLNSYANVYTDKGEPKKAVKKLYQIINSYKSLNDKELIDRFQLLNYSNIANIYLLYNIDSANYFANKSIDLATSENYDDKAMISNYLVLAKFHKSKNDYAKSLLNYHKSVDLSEKIGEKLNITGTYKDIVELYKLLGQKDSAIVYENKLKQNEIAELQSKYNSLHEVIDKDQKEEDKSISFNNNKLILTIIAVSAVLTVFIGLIFKKWRRKNEDPHEVYNQLLNLLKQKNPVFMFAFESKFPDFAPNLLKINPQLISSEIEFCAFLKLKLSTKEIADITCIEPRTVQNKKHRIRKKLNIPSDVDIYYWIDMV